MKRHFCKDERIFVRDCIDQHTDTAQQEKKKREKSKDEKSNITVDVQWPGQHIILVLRISAKGAGRQAGGGGPSQVPAPISGTWLQLQLHGSDTAT